MKKLALLIATITAMTSSVSTIAETVEQADVYQQAYALYMLYHSNNKDQTTPSLIKQYPQDYVELFKGNKKVTQQQFVQFEQARLEPLLKQRREMSEKQAHVRFGILDNNKDQKLTLKEFQETGLKTFNQFDKNQDGLINAEDAKLSDNTNATHDGFRVKLPISMPMPSNTQEFITQYGQGKTMSRLEII
jgi:Ca2+-binding EF-hand superfamily protein